MNVKNFKVFPEIFPRMGPVVEKVTKDLPIIQKLRIDALSLIFYSIRNTTYCVITPLYSIQRQSSSMTTAIDGLFSCSEEESKLCSFDNK